MINHAVVCETVNENYQSYINYKGSESLWQGNLSEQAIFVMCGTIGEVNMDKHEMLIKVKCLNCFKWQFGREQ